MTLDIDIQTASGKNPEAISRILELRKKELGQTTKDSLTALAINILRSARGETKVASPRSKGNIKVERLMLRPSFKREGGKIIPVIRDASGSQVQVKAKWLSVKGDDVKTLGVFKVTDLSRGDDKRREYIFVAKSEKQAFDFVNDIRTRRINSKKGLAKFALGIAMNKVHNENVNDAVSARTNEIANKNVSVSVNESGFDSGDVSIHIHDMLDYSQLALKSGGLDLSIQKTLNKMTAYLIHQLHNKGIFDESLKIPYPELQRNTR